MALNKLFQHALYSTLFTDIQLVYLMDGSAVAHFVDTFVQLFHEAMKQLRSSVRAHALIPGKIRVREISATTAAFVIIAERYATVIIRQLANFHARPFSRVNISDLQIGVRGRLRVRILSSEHAHFQKFRPLNLQRVLRTENSYSLSYSYSDLKVANS